MEQDKVKDEVVVELYLPGCKKVETALASIIKTLIIQSI
jgi:hypothetical protein